MLSMNHGQVPFIRNGLNVVNVPNDRQNIISVKHCLNVYLIYTNNPNTVRCIKCKKIRYWQIYVSKIQMYRLINELKLMMASIHFGYNETRVRIIFRRKLSLSLYVKEIPEILLRYLVHKISSAIDVPNSFNKATLRRVHSCCMCILAQTRPKWPVKYKHFSINEVKIFRKKFYKRSLTPMNWTNVLYQLLLLMLAF